MLNEEELLQLFRKRGALLTGHFKLTSGRHASQYMQCAKIMQYPEDMAVLCQELAEKFQNMAIDAVAGPAMGAIIMSYEMARALKVRSIFGEREDDVMTFRRGFQVFPGDKVLVVEDVVTTGGSCRDAIEAVRKAGGEVVGVGSLVDRSNGTVDFGLPFFSLLKLNIANYAVEACPLCEQGLPLVKPGSRKL